MLHYTMKSPLYVQLLLLLGQPYEGGQEEDRRRLFPRHPLRLDSPGVFADVMAEIWLLTCRGPLKARHRRKSTCEM